MRVRDKEHQSLGIKALLELCEDYPNDSALGHKIRTLTRKGNNINLELTKEDLEDWREGTIWGEHQQ